MRRPLAAILLIGSVFAVVPHARAQMETREGIALQNQILELRHEIEMMRQQGAGGYPSNVAPAYRAPPPSRGGASGDLTAQLLDRVSALEEQVRTLRGQVDELQNAQQRTSQDLGKRIDDLAFQMQQGAGGGAQSPAAPPSRATPTPAPGPQGSLGTVPAGPAATPRRTPELAMQQGNAALARRDYAAAEADAREVLSGHGPRAYDGQFLLAQALAGQRKWQDAALAYDDTYTRSKTGGHAQDALLGLANSLTSLGDKRAACGALDKLKKEFPNPRRDLREPIASARSRASCS